MHKSPNVKLLFEWICVCSFWEFLGNFKIEDILGKLRPGLYLVKFYWPFPYFQILFAPYLLTHLNFSVHAPSQLWWDIGGWLCHSSTFILIQCQSSSSRTIYQIRIDKWIRTGISGWFQHNSSKQSERSSLRGVLCGLWGQSLWTSLWRYLVWRM